MALTNAYLQTTKNLHSIINSVISAKAPERFTNKFLEDLGFKSSNDRLYIKVYPLSRTFLSNRQTVTVTFPADNFLFPIGCMK